MLMQMHFSGLLQYLIATYFAHLTSVLIVYDNGIQINMNDANCDAKTLPDVYLMELQQALLNQSAQGNFISLQWLNVQHFNETTYQSHLLTAINAVTEGFITIVSNTSKFLHARYYATRYSRQRLKDKFYLFLCEHELPAELLANELLQFVQGRPFIIIRPHHLAISHGQKDGHGQFDSDFDAEPICIIEVYPQHVMVVPTNINLKENQNYNKANSSGANAATRKPQNLKQTSWFFGNTATTRTVAKLQLMLDIVGTPHIITSNTSTYSQQQQRQHYENSKCVEWYRRDINFELWTQKFVGAVGNLNAKHLDTYIASNGTFTNNGAELYVNKLSNLQGRTIRVGTVTYAPYVVSNVVSPGEGNVDGVDSQAPNKTVLFIGAEAQAIITFCQLHNCHLRVNPYGADNWGVIYENETGTDMMGALYEQQVEVAIGCIYDWYDDITETSQVIARSSVTILGPAPEQFPRWRINIMPFSLRLWLFIFFTIILCAVAFHLIKSIGNRLSNQSMNEPNTGYMNYFDKTFLDIFAIFIQQPSADTVLNRIATRLCLASLLCATITLENTYSGQLKSILTRPIFTEPVDTMEKWSKTDWKWGTPSIIWITSVKNSDFEREQILSQRFEIHDKEFLYNASFWSNYGLGIERLFSGAFTFGSYITQPVLENKIVLKDDLYFDWTRAVGIRGWPLMPLLNTHILNYMETGIYTYWERKIAFKYLDQKIQDILVKLASGYKVKFPPQTLTLNDISGSLYILLFGYLIALLAFLLEILMHSL